MNRTDGTIEQGESMLTAQRLIAAQRHIKELEKRITELESELSGYREEAAEKAAMDAEWTQYMHQLDANRKLAASGLFDDPSDRHFMFVSAGV